MTEEFQHKRQRQTVVVSVRTISALQHIQLNVNNFVFHARWQRKTIKITSGNCPRCPISTAVDEWPVSYHGLDLPACTRVNSFACLFCAPVEKLKCRPNLFSYFSRVHNKYREMSEVKQSAV